MATIRRCQRFKTPTLVELGSVCWCWQGLCCCALRPTVPAPLCALVVRAPLCPQELQGAALLAASCNCVFAEGGCRYLVL